MKIVLKSLCLNIMRRQYDKQKRFSLNYGEKPLDAILRSADNGQFELKILNSGAYHHYEVIDTYYWSKH